MDRFHQQHVVVHFAGPGGDGAWIEPAAFLDHETSDRRRFLAMKPSTPLQDALDELDLERSATRPGALQAVTDLAIEIAREGREGRRIGTLFTLGAEDVVLSRSRCLILDPLAGHPLKLRRLDNPDLRETLKELAQLDGGFVISGRGVALSACRYFESQLTTTAQPLGLGTRHIAAASISATTGAIAVVVSESSIVRVYSAGELVTEILPEVWLLRRYMPHIAQYTVTDDRESNVAIVSESREALRHNH